MDPTPRHRAAEHDFRQLLRSGGVAQPDWVDYAPDELLFGWSEQKLAVVVDLESPPALDPLAADHEAPRSAAGREAPRSAAAHEAVAHEAPRSGGAQEAPRSPP